MHVVCKIFSSNFILHLKLKDFINNTPFFLLSDFNQDTNEEQIIFWDVDSKDIDRGYIEKFIKNGSLIMIIYSLYNVEFILKNLANDEKIRIGLLPRNFSYKDFVEEISRIADANLLDSQ